MSVCPGNGGNRYYASHKGLDLPQDLSKRFSRFSRGVYYVQQLQEITTNIISDSIYLIEIDWNSNVYLFVELAG